MPVPGSSSALPPNVDQRAGQQVLDRYLIATSNQDEKMRGLAMHVEIRASLPRLNRTGRMNAIRFISRLGKITYRAMTFQGDDSIKKDVIARYLQAEVEAGTGQKSLKITPENYKFEYWGIYGEGDWRLHLFELEPKKKRSGLFKGWLWVEANTGLPVREQGELVKNPSVFLRKVEFVRDYELRDGVARPIRIESTIQTRLVGSAEVSVRFSDYEAVSETAEANHAQAVNLHALRRAPAGFSR
jgi:hypothetical protein